MNILGYKVAYVMGVSEEILDTDFRKMQNLSQSVQYFIDKPITNLCRALARVYFKLLKDKENFLKDEDLATRFESELSPLFKAADFTYKKVFSQHVSFYDFVCQLAAFFNANVSSSYDELKPPIALSGFETLVGLKILTPLETDQYKHLLDFCYTRYGIFFKYELLNAEQVTLFSDDNKARVLLRSITGYNVHSIVPDRSILADIERKMRNESFISIQGLESYHKIILCKERMKPFHLSRINKLSDTIKEKIIDLPDEEAISDFVDSLSGQVSGDICVVTTAKNVEELSSLAALDCDIVLGLPLRKNVYTRVLSRDYKNVFLFSYPNK